MVETGEPLRSRPEREVAYPHGGMRKPVRVVVLLEN